MSKSNTNDRELLELAAQAAGIKCEWRDGCFCYASTPYDVAWNPLTYSAHALELAVKLGIDISFGCRVRPKRDEPYVAVDVDAAGAWMDLQNEPFNGDPLAATRRAIVRAAAAIGRTAPADRTQA
jgi:hypothetical protein